MLVEDIEWILKNNDTNIILLLNIVFGGACNQENMR
jgi:hypothetical protein